MNIFTISNVPVIQSQGSGYVIQGFVDRLRERGHHIDLVEPKDYQKFPRLNKGHRLRLQLGYTAACKQAIDSGRYDVIQAFGAEAWHAFWQCHRLPGRPLLVAHSNGVEPHVTEQLSQYGPPSGTGLGRLMDKFMYIDHAFRCADGVITVSQFDTDYLLAKGWQSAETIATINNALPDFFLGQEIEEARPMRIGYCGTWSMLKGKDALESALPRLFERFPEAEFEILGTLDSLVPEKVFPSALCKRLVHIPKLTREDLCQHYHKWAVSLMPSRYESFGLSAAEAVACGAALVATRTGFAASMDDGHEAMLLERSTPELLVEKVAQLLTDENRRQRIARAGWQRVQALSWPQAIDRFEDFVGQIKPCS